MKVSQETLDQVLAIALGAGEKILGIYESDIAVTTKDDDSPLTQADLAAHHHIVAGLQALAPEIPVLSEEAADIPYATRRQWSRYWLVDPLDGTKEFIKRNGEFTVNIALVDNGVAVLGVVHGPVLKTSWIAAQGLGAWRLENGQKTAIRTRKSPARPALVVSKSHRDAALESFLEKMPEHDAVSRGSSLKFCLVADGVADLYPRTGPTSEWDTAAGQCVAEQAGAQVLVMPGLQPLRYNQKESLLNPLFVVIGDPAAGWAERLPKA
ncbi:3'(2'),5'-bisphosphate nucleotidase CysQ [Solimonas sp. K1W22B-7]|uniref:3'(2'),5'-bisphosphate nucleotidase CysQ n=1 Tax=Solimonas sp. K1W22B-7 TaxID=2303331 RepID=UPI001F09F3AA|nr:3'(2'),5'-bisphosphate nucleotidase CysQ [Solimonas sp. K1W22B-7]